MLFLKELKLKNWCNLTTEKTINFEKGFNVINGKNGSGKTSIVNAISILLLNRYDGNWESFINNNKDEASIILTFNVDNDEYTSSVFLTKKGKTVSSVRKLTKNNIDIASGEDCEKELNKILPSFLTSYSLIYRQSSDDKVTDCSDSERRDLLTQLVALDYSEKVNQFITPNINSITEKINQLEKEKYSLENKTYSFGELKEVKEKHSEKEIEKLQNLVKDFELNEQNKKLKNQLEIKKNNLQNELLKIKEDYSIENLQKEKSKEIESYRTLIQFTPTDYEREINEYKESTKEDLASTIKALVDITKRFNSIQLLNFEDFDNSKLDKVISELSSLETQKSILGKNIRSLEKGICPICGNNCTHKLAEVKTEFANISNQISTLYSTKNSLEIEKQKIEDIKKKNEENIRLQNNLQLDIKDLENQIEAKKQEIQNHVNELKNERESKVRSYENKIISTESLYNEKINSANTIISNKEDELKSILNEFDSINIYEIEDCRDELNRLEKENNEIDQTISYNKAIESQNELTKKQQETDKVNLESLTKTLIDLKNSLADYKLASEIMTKTYPTWKLEKDITEIENKTNLFIEEIYKPLYIKFSANKNSLKMTYGNGERELTTKRLSGAEKQIVNLAVENVFNQQQNLSCIILDECDSAMDKNNKEMFFDTLLSLSDYYEQILVITHSNEVKNKLQVEGCNIILL